MNYKNMFLGALALLQVSCSSPDLEKCIDKNNAASSYHATIISSPEIYHKDIKKHFTFLDRFTGGKLQEVSEITFFNPEQEGCNLEDFVTLHEEDDPQFIAGFTFQEGILYINSTIHRDYYFKTDLPIPYLYSMIDRFESGLSSTVAHELAHNIYADNPIENVEEEEVAKAFHVATTYTYFSELEENSSPLIDNFLIPAAERGEFPELSIRTLLKLPLLTPLERDPHWYEFVFPLMLERGYISDRYSKTMQDIPQLIETAREKHREWRVEGFAEWEKRWLEEYQ